MVRPDWALQARRLLSTRTVGWRASRRLIAFQLGTIQCRGLARTAAYGQTGFGLNDGKALSQKFVDFFPPTKTADIRQVTTSNVGQVVTLSGYLGSRSDLSGKISFSSIVDENLTHSIQIISNAADAADKEQDAHAILKQATQHSAVIVKGTVQLKQKPKNAKPKESLQRPDIVEPQRAEDVELVLQQITILNAFPPSITMQTDTVFPAEQRHLHLRSNGQNRYYIQSKAKMAAICRRSLEKLDFLEVETPLLFKSTPEGAREFLVPTRRPGQFYALPQSPQQYKQLLMASGVPRYFQFARCFRDEDLRADRQPEFTQLDLEVAFATSDRVMDYVETLIKELLVDFKLDYEIEDKKFERMTYTDAMNQYGSDKPDVRDGMEIHAIEHFLTSDAIAKVTMLEDPIVEVFNLSLGQPPSALRELVKQFVASQQGATLMQNPDGAPTFFFFDSRSPASGLGALGFEAASAIETTLDANDGDLIVLQARPRLPHSGGSTALGRARIALRQAALSAELWDPPQSFRFIWVQQFPMFKQTTADDDPGQGGAAGFASNHHPFTAPATAADLDLLSTDPLSAVADHFDLVLNGIELGGGSRRIHDAALQEYVFRSVLKMSDERVKDFDHLLGALSHGCPPHAGFALGFDRLAATLLGRESIRDVIAFPKTGSGEDALVKSPTDVSPQRLAEYHLKLAK